MIVDVEPHGEGSVDATGTGQADGPAPSPVLLLDTPPCPLVDVRATDGPYEWRMHCAKDDGHAGRCVTTWTETGRR